MKKSLLFDKAGSDVLGEQQRMAFCSPMLDMSYPSVATHFRFLIGAIDVDFENLEHSKFITSSAS